MLTRTKDGATAYYVYGIGLLYEDVSGAAKQYHFDHIGNTVAITSASQTVTDTITYAPFGAIATRAGSTDTPFLFGGSVGIQLEVSGLLYMRARFYNPRLMRFLTSDPIQFDGGPNWYAFVENNPIGYVDPLGTQVDVLDEIAGIPPGYNPAIPGQINRVDVEWNAALNKTAVAGAILSVPVGVVAAPGAISAAGGIYSYAGTTSVGIAARVFGPKLPEIATGAATLAAKVTAQPPGSTMASLGTALKAVKTWFTGPSAVKTWITKYLSRTPSSDPQSQPSRKCGK